MSDQTFDRKDGPGMYAVACSVMRTTRCDVTVIDGQLATASSHELRTMLITTIADSRADAIADGIGQAREEFKPTDGWLGYEAAAVKIVVTVRGSDSPLIVDEMSQVIR